MSNKNEYDDTKESSSIKDMYDKYDKARTELIVAIKEEFQQKDGFKKNNEPIIAVYEIDLSQASEEVCSKDILSLLDDEFIQCSTSGPFTLKEFEKKINNEYFSQTFIRFVTR